MAMRGQATKPGAASIAIRAAIPGDHSGSGSTANLHQFLVQDPDGYLIRFAAPEPVRRLSGLRPFRFATPSE
jgi:hypothetical protein